MALKRDVVVIGGSAGGIPALLTLVSKLPADLPAAVFVVIHLAPDYASRLPELLNARGALRASHPVDGELHGPGRMYIAPPDNHLTLRGPYISVARGPKENGHRPSVDALFRSAASAYGPRVIGVVLSGYLDCGTAGLLSIKARGGLAIAQDPAEAQASSMPASAVRNVALDHVLKVDDIAPLLARLTQETVAPLRAQLSSELLELEGERTGAPAPLVCPSCQGVLTEVEVGSFSTFRCHVGHVFSLAAVVAGQAESLERALWAAVRALEESASLTQRLAQRSSGHLRVRFEEKEQYQRQQAETIKHLLLSPDSLSANDASVVLGRGEEDKAGE